MHGWGASLRTFMSNAGWDFSAETEKKPMRKSLGVAVVCLLLILPIQAFTQSSNASLSGTISDSTGAVLPGATITAKNTGTDIIITAASNAAGVYSFLSVPPGIYEVTAGWGDLQAHTFTNVEVGNAAQVKLNFILGVKRLEEKVVVTVAPDRVLLDGNSSVGSVLPEKQVEALPLVTNNALDLVKLLGGVVMGNNPLWDADSTSFAGVTASNINVQRDGITTNDVRYPTGINSPTRLNPDMVAEFRMILSPVDAEMGRGSGQVQVLTKSGTNNLHGGVVWNIRNSAIDANTWYNNSRNVTAPFSNQQEYSISAGGPIVKNKTFFFVLWNQQVSRQRVPINPRVLTPCARKGIFRYYDNWTNGNTDQVTGFGTNASVRVVNNDGTPTAQYIPYLNPADSGSGPHNGQLRAFSVFKPLLHFDPNDYDCSEAVFDESASSWDRWRTDPDPTGWVGGTFLNLMAPTPNNYQVGDGLNVAGYRWNRTLNGGANLWGIGEDNQRKQINIKIDHNFNNTHRISGSWSYDRLWADDSYKNWPNGYGGINKLNPQVLAVNLTSSFKGVLLNEMRFGMTRTGTNVYAPLDTPGSGEKLRPLFPSYNGLPVLIGPGSAGSNFGIEMGFFSTEAPSHFYGTSGILPIGYRDTSPRWTIGDTISWNRGRHLLKGGVDVRFTSSESINKGSVFQGTTYPYAAGGSTGDFSSLMMFNPMPPGMNGDSFTANTNRNNFEGLLNFLSGSIASLQQYYFINSPNDTAWNDPTKVNEKIRNFQQREFSFFFKDEWKVSNSLNLNLGVRYEWYGVPYLKSGLTAGLKGGGNSIFGPGLGFANWMKPGAGDPNFRTEVNFVGPNSPNSGQQIYNDDWNNFAPFVGFAWDVPWLGKGKTTVRGGYAINYDTPGRASSIVDYFGETPGMSQSSTWRGEDWGTGYFPYLDLRNLAVASPVPINPAIKPMQPFPITDRSATLTAFDPNLATPYTQHLTLQVTHNISPNLTLDLRYIGNLSRKLPGTLDINAPNFMNNGLLEAFNAARRGDDTNPATQLLDRMFNVAAGQGADALRAANINATQIYLYSPPSFYLARGQYATLANLLNGTAADCGYRGCLMGRMGSQNFIKSNPQFNTANLYTNLGSSNYNGFQAQVTLRPTHGANFQGTYTWSRNLGYTGGSYTDPRDRRADYTLLAMHRTHTFTAFGGFDLPFGPNKLLLNSRKGALARIVEGWQLSWTGNLATGMPASLVAASMLYGNGTPDQVGPFNSKDAVINWQPGATSGSYFNTAYQQVSDPQCSDTGVVLPSLRSGCEAGLKALALLNDPGRIILKNPLPGNRGNVGRNTLFSPNTWNVDMALSKSVKLTETKSLSIRVDVSNVFNHVQPAGSIDTGRRTTQRVETGYAPSFDVNSTTVPFGNMAGKYGSRMFQAKARFDF
jgi:hypothetical protein